MSATPQQRAALLRLLLVAENDPVHGETIARFLLALHRSDLYHFDLRAMRPLDLKVFSDCLLVLGIDFTARCPLGGPGEPPAPDMRSLAQKWGIEPTLVGSATPMKANGSPA